MPTRSHLPDRQLLRGARQAERLCAPVPTRTRPGCCVHRWTDLVAALTLRKTGGACSGGGLAPRLAGRRTPADTAIASAGTGGPKVVVGGTSNAVLPRRREAAFSRR